MIEELDKLVEEGFKENLQKEDWTSFYLNL